MYSMLPIMAFITGLFRVAPLYIQYHRVDVKKIQKIFITKTTFYLSPTTSYKKPFLIFSCISRCLLRKHMETSSSYLAKFVINNEYDMSCLADQQEKKEC